jgi:uncharacterized protein (TIGR02246 family)
VPNDHDAAAAVFERRRDAWLREDLDAYIRLFADDVVLETPMGEAVHGREAYTALVRRSYEALAPVSFVFHEIAARGPKVLAEWTITMRVRADGREISYRGMSICELSDGLIRTWREYYDPSHLRPK